jgi:DNA polymerase-3 subunit delta'
MCVGSESTPQASALPPWLEPTFVQLAGALERGQLAHALMIHGPSGWGEVLLANALALAIVRAPTDAPPAAQYAHPDLRWLAPEKPGSQIKVDDVRALADFVARTATGGENKVAVIADAEAMNIAAANALLKTLEEPPPRTHIILATTRPASLPPTVRSRCQSVLVRANDLVKAQAWWEARAPNVDATRRRTLGFEYADAPLEIVDALARDEKPLAPELTRALDPAVPIMAVADALAKEDLATVVTRWMRYLPNELARRARGAAPEEPLSRALAAAPESHLHRFWAELVWARRLLVGTSNPNRRLLLDTLLLGWRDLRHGSSH